MNSSPPGPIEPDSLLANNRAWAQAIQAEDPHFFQRLATQQAPQYLWIGCSDSRVPANQITGLAPGEVFVHRNIANVLVHSDLNALSVIQFAVDLLQVRHIMVVGHYGCSGVRAALEHRRLGVADNWLRHVRDVHERHVELLHPLAAEARHDALCALNSVEQALHVCQTTVVQDAWARAQALTVHGWVYGLDDGLLHELGFCVSRAEEVVSTHTAALALLRERFAAGRGR